MRIGIFAVLSPDKCSVWSLMRYRQFLVQIYVYIRLTGHGTFMRLRFLLRDDVNHLMYTRSSWPGLMATSQ